MTQNDPPDLRMRTKQFALRIIRLYSALPNTNELTAIFVTCVKKAKGE
jgi:hypothetical protein